MSGFRRGMIAAASVDPLKKVPLTLTAVQAGSTVALNATGSPTVSGLQYRYGTSGAWSAYTCGTALTLASVEDAVQFQNTENALSTGSNDYVSFAFSGKIAASGNAMSMLNWREVCSDYCYRRMFYNCTGLTQAPELPATTLVSNCYSYMFSYCKELTSVRVSFTAWGSGNTKNWLYAVASGGTFHKPSALPNTRGVSNIPEGWTVVNID